uniref:NADH-ubiquinone oxidoreductase chain 2 n=2 Tax=Kalotermitidae TaxID=46562 RepID=A0A8X8RHH4_9NEOP|nr:NADH dehydrogenase subunit 2 [Glyptotermes sp. 13 AB-2022a]URX53850.1 NADH dehydrogenase subunit 2 [Postelectrotermes sp. 2 AB-2022a]URX53863.1 NADH dehydrogenase subunit 2 [Postelectrotermes sp. 2 AB-2022a]
MSINPTKTLLSTTLVGGILISISSNSWFSAWMGLEINLMSFIPLMLSQENIYTTEASLKYFIVQALASSILLFMVVMKMLVNQNMITNGGLYSYAIMTPLLLKMGAAPMHWWFPKVMEGLSWMNCLLMMTVQKIAPMMLTSYLVEMNLLILMVIMTSVIIGSVGGMNQTSLRKILTYSSINHTGWMLAAMLSGDNLWVMYFAIYSLLTLIMTTITKSYNISFINQVMADNSKTPIKFMLFTTLLSLGGLPPFIGFFPKWIVIQMMIMNNMSFIVTAMVTMSLVTLYYYLRMCYSSFIILHEEMKWSVWTHKENKITSYSILLSSMSMMGLIMCTMIINFN